MTNIKEVKFRWTIKNFHVCAQSPGEHIISPNFSLDSSKVFDFNLRLYPRGNDLEEDGKYISLFLVGNHNSGQNKIILQYNMSLIDDKGSCSKTMKSTTARQFSKDTNNWGFKKFCERDLLLSKQGSHVLPENNLTVECRLMPFPENENNVEDSRSYDEQCSEILSLDLAKMFKNGVHSDMEILVDDETFSVHKAVLECRCPKLVAQLKKSVFPKTFSLSSMKAPDIQELLLYLYTGKFRTCCMNQDIFIASCFYDLPDLRNAFPYPSSISASTEINASRISFRWIITDFNKLQSNKELVYPGLYDENNMRDRMKIIVTFIQSKDGCNVVLLKFQNQCMKKVIFFGCKVTIGEPGKTPTIVKEFEKFIKNEEDWIISYSHTALSENLCNDSLSMYFEICMSNGEQYSKIEEISFVTKAQKADDESIKNLVLLQKDLQNLHSDSKFADITLCVGDAHLPACKAILCARSQVFEKMFEHDTLENQKGVITIEDMDVSTVSSMLLYICCGCIDKMNISETVKMYEAADRYELFHLKEKCTTFLKSNLNAENVGEILLLADSHHDENLKRRVFDFITSNSKEVRNSKTFLSALNSRSTVYPDVITELMERISSQK